MPVKSLGLRVEVGLGLLHMRLPDRSLLVGVGEQRPD